MIDHRTTPSSEDSPATSSAQAASLGRRRAMLKGLGKGGTLLAAAAPMTSFAVGRVKTADGKQCTVSGQMSVVMSSAASVNPCLAFHPTAFFKAETVNISSLTSTLQTVLNNAATRSYTGRSAAVYFKGSAASTTVRKLTPAMRTAGFTRADLKVSQIFTGATDRLVLEELHSNSEGTDAYFLAAFFSALLTSPPTANSEKVPFAGTDVQSHWGAGTRNSAKDLYVLVCREGKDTNKLG